MTVIAVDRHRALHLAAAEGGGRQRRHPVERSCDSRRRARRNRDPERPGDRRAARGATGLLDDHAFYIALLLAAFTILFGTRHLDATERHEGMVAAIAFESLVKLLAFMRSACS